MEALCTCGRACSVRPTCNTGEEGQLGGEEHGEARKEQCLVRCSLEAQLFEGGRGAAARATLVVTFLCVSIAAIAIARCRLARG